MRYLALLWAWWASLLLFNPRNGMLHALLWMPKLLAAAFSSFLALAGVWGVLVGVLRRDWRMLGAGVLTTAVSLKHIRTATASRDDAFAAAFGPDWRERVPDNLRPHLPARRWTWLVAPPLQGELQRNVTYGKNPESGLPLLADILLPPSGVAPTGLTLLYVHGGGWRFGKKNIRKFPYFRHLSAQGHLVMDIDYTLSPYTTLLGQVRDVKRAILWLKAHAEEFGVNPERIVLGGQSAGGHLALLAGYTQNMPVFQPPEEQDGDTAVCGVVSYYGPVDMLALHNDVQAEFGRYAAARLPKVALKLLERAGNDVQGMQDGIAGIVGSSPADDPQIYRLLSPITYASAACPPTLFLHGVHDFLVSARESKRLYAALRQAGAPVVFLSFPGCDHGFDSIFPQVSPAAQTAAYYTEYFLALLV